MHRTQNPIVPAADTDDLSVITPADILRGAATYLEIHGWHQGDYYALIAEVPFPPACVSGAIGMAAHGKRIEAPTHCGAPGAREFRLAFHYLTDYLDGTEAALTLIPFGTDYDEPIEYTPDLFTWNDSYGQTAENVIDTLRAAADDYDRTHAATTGEQDSELIGVPLLDVGGYLACGCHGTQRDHTCDTAPEGEDW